jgi:hypothetical protein
LDINRQTYFELFSIVESFDIDPEALGESYKKLQAQYHPDRVSGLDDTARLQALQTSSIINQAFGINHNLDAMILKDRIAVFRLIDKLKNIGHARTTGCGDTNTDAHALAAVYQLLCHM